MNKSIEKKAKWSSWISKEDAYQMGIAIGIKRACQFFISNGWFDDETLAGEIELKNFEEIKNIKL
jgi:hypothetical protein